MIVTSKQLARRIHALETRARLKPHELVKLRLRSLRKAQEVARELVRLAAEKGYVRAKKVGAKVTVHEEELKHRTDQWKDPWLRVYVEVSYRWLKEPGEEEQGTLGKEMREVARGAGAKPRRTQYAQEFLFEGSVGKVTLSAAAFSTTLRFFLETQVPWYAKREKSKEAWLQILNKRF